MTLSLIEDLAILSMFHRLCKLSLIVPDLADYTKKAWSYNKMSVVNKQGGTDFLFGARASQSSSTQSFDLIITFDSNDIVSDYSVISTSY